MKRIKLLAASAIILSAFSSCLDPYQELNTDPELQYTSEARRVFTGATRNFNNCSRAHLTGKYGGVMVYMQYLVPAGGASKGYYVIANEPSRPEPYSPSYQYYFTANGDDFGAFGLRLDYLINEVIPAQTEASRYVNVENIARILLAYQQWQVLDTYGAAPITQGLKWKSEGIQKPQYDLYQKAVDGTPMYKKLDADIKAAVEKLKNADKNQYELGNFDFFYNGDISKWIKFGNTLRVKMAQRVEKADATFYNSVINEVLTSADNILAANDESCIYHHPNDYNNTTDDIQDITKSYCASRAFVDFLKTYEDPRLPLLVRRNGFGTGNNNKENDEWFKTFRKAYPDTTKFEVFLDRYVGMSANPDSAASSYSQGAYMTLPYKKDDGTAANLDIRMNSQVESRYFVKNGGKNGNNNMPNREIEGPEFEINQDKIGAFTPILTYPETCLMLAEIAFKKGGAVAGKDAKAWFHEGIKASMLQYAEWAKNMYVVSQVNPDAENYMPVTEEAIDAYLAKPEFQNVTLPKIISQQWVNLFMQPEEMWATWKRTGLPAFKDHPTPVDGVAFLETIHSGSTTLVIPRRNKLPVPNSLNLENFNAAVSALKTDAKYGTDYDRTEGRVWWDMP